MEFAPYSSPRRLRSTSMSRYDRNRDAEGRWREDDEFARHNYGRGQQPPRDDRGRFLSEGETGDYYGNGRNQNREYGGGGGERSTDRGGGGPTGGRGKKPPSGKTPDTGGGE